LRDTSPKLVSYTVDLVAPDRVGGTNIPGRAKPPPQAKPAPAPRAAAVSEPPVPPKPPEPVKKEPPPKAVKKEAVPPPKPVAKPKVAPKKEPVKVSAKKAEKPKPAAAKEKAKPAEKKAVAEKPKAAPAKEEAAKPELSPQEARDAIAARLRDERLAAAVGRAASRVQEQDAVGDSDAPASYGPGEGAGGILKGLDWIMYKNRVETLIRENWAWTGSDRSLEATVSFGISEAGEVVNVRVEQSSGDPTYDASIERAIKAVSPLPPPPEAYRQEFSQYELTFNAEFLQM
jgi:colicin import membrane protein